jgi:hypothetical protein
VSPHIALADANRFRAFLERPQRVSLSTTDISESIFHKTLIAQDPYKHLVTEHFHQYPVSYIDLKASCLVNIHKECADRFKNVQGATDEQMLSTFNEMILDELLDRDALFQDGIVDARLIRWYQEIQSTLS